MDNQQEFQKSNQQKKKPWLLLFITAAIVLAATIGTIVYQQQKNKQRCQEKYQAAISAMQNKEYEIAITLFQELGEYGDSVEMIQECLDAQDAQAVENLQILYRAINTIYKADKELIRVVSTIIQNANTISNASHFMSTPPDIPVSYLYHGQGYQRQHSCSLWDASTIKASIGSAAQIYEGGSRGYTVAVTIHNQSTAQSFVDLLESTPSMQKTIEELIDSADNVPEKYLEVRELLISAYEALKNCHSFVANEPKDFENYDTASQEKLTAVANALSAAQKLEPAISR